MPKKPFYFNLTIKLFLFLFFTGVVAVFAVSTFSYFNTKRALLDRTFQQLTSVRVLKKRQLESFFKDRINDVQYLVSSPNITALIHLLNNNNDNPYIEWMSDKKMLKASAHYSNIYVTNFEKCIKVSEDEDGRFNIVFDDEDTFFDCSAFIKLKEGLVNDKLFFISDFVENSEFQKNQKLFIGAPAYINGQLAGMVAFDIEYTVINAIMLEKDSRSGLGKSGESYLVGNDFMMRSSSRFNEDLFLKTPVKTIAVENAINRIEGVDIVVDYRGIKVLSSYSPLEIMDLNWVILAEIDLKEAMIPIKSSRNKIILISIIIVALLLPVCYLLTEKITHPIIKLKNAMDIVSEGDYDIEVEDPGHDEIGALTKTFNSMASKLHKQTAVLLEREERLRHFYEATKDGIVLHFNGKPLLINQALCDMTLFSEEELMRMHIDGFLIQGKSIKAGKENKMTIYDGLLVKKDQTILEVEVQETNIDFKQMTAKAMVIRDVALRKKVEKALAQERAQRLSSMIDGQEQERQRLSRELHDSLGQLLIAIKIQLESFAGDNTEKDKHTLAKVRSMFDATIEEVRRISNNLMPAVLYEFGIQTALSNLCNRVEETAGFKIEFYSNLTSDNHEKRIKTYLYRIAQEALNNCVKHSKATLVKVYLIENEGHIKLIVKDNGIGFVPDKTNAGYGNGILNMRERAQLIHSKIDIFSDINKGTEVVIEIPKNKT